MLSSVPIHVPAILGKRAQLGFVVSDMSAALRDWTERLGVGPFVLFEQSIGSRRFVHRGDDSPVEFSLAFSYIGDLQIELIGPSNSAPSPYTEFFESGREGVSPHCVLARGL